MADTKISELEEVVSPASTDVLPIVSDGETKKVQVQNLTGAAAGALLVVNNLSDVDDVAETLINLGVGPRNAANGYPGLNASGLIADSQIPSSIARDSETTAAISAEAATRAAADAALQPLDSDLTSIAAIAPTNDDLIQRKAGAWTNRTPAQVKTDLALTKGDVGLGNADNTSDLSKPISTATQAALDLKVDENAAITGATKTKITYDAKGLVTAGADATTADIADSSNKRYVTDANLTVIGNTSGVNTGDQVLTSVLASSISDGDTTHAPDGNSVFDALALKANDNAVAKLTGDQTIAGVKTFSSDPIIPDEAYGAGWNGSLEPPTKNAVFDKIETLGSSGIGGSTGSTDNAILRADGTGGSTAQSSLVTVSDAGAINLGTAGSAGTPAISISTDTNTGFYSRALGFGLLGFTSAGTAIFEARGEGITLRSASGYNFGDIASGADAGIWRSAARRVKATDGGSTNLGDFEGRQYFIDQTITAPGTTGNQTINKAAGTVNIAAGGTAVTVTNSLCTTSSLVFAVLRTNDGTATIKNVVPGAGSFVITLGAAATAEVSIGFIVINQ